MRITLVITACAIAIIAGTDVYAQTETTREVSPINRRFGQSNVTKWLAFSDLSVIAPGSVELRRWQRHPSDSGNRGRSVSEGGRANASNGRSRKKAVLIGTSIGAGVGAGGGAYAMYATGGDAEPWIVPAFAGLGAAVGAICGFVISLF